MQIVPTRATAVRALESRRNQLLLEDRKEEATTVERDRRLIARAPGDDLYQMAQFASEKAARIQGSALARDARAGWPMGPIGFGLGLAGGAVGGAIGYGLQEVLHAPIELALPIGLLSLFCGLGCAFIPEYVYQQGEKAAVTAQAIDRNYNLIQSFSGEPEGRLAMTDFVRLGAQRESELLCQGHPLRATEMKRVCTNLQSLAKPTLEESLDEVYRRAHDGPQKKHWEQILTTVQESPDVLGLVRPMLEVGNLSEGLESRGGSLEVRPDAVRIGSVVLRPKR